MSGLGFKLQVAKSSAAQPALFSPGPERVYKAAKIGQGSRCGCQTLPHLSAFLRPLSSAHKLLASCANNLSYLFLHLNTLGNNEIRSPQLVESSGHFFFEMFCRMEHLPCLHFSAVSLATKLWKSLNLAFANCFGSDLP